jgi:type IV secretory pathway VirB2 component (pilin)
MTVFTLMLAATFLLSANLANAAQAILGPASGVGAYGGGTIGNLLCNVAFWFTGTVGQGIATLSVIVLGIGALFGKVSQGMAITTMVGIAVIFGAPQIVTELTGQAACYGSYF